MMTTADFLRGCEYLSKVDATVSNIIQQQGTTQQLTRRSSAMQCLAQSIVGQQISTKAAQSIWARLLVAFGGECTPQNVLACTETTLRNSGLSARKASYLHNIALFLSSTDIESHPDARGALLAVKGIGPWTYDMFAIFYLLEPDVLPLGDVGLVRAMRNLYCGGETTDKDTLEKIAVPWQPYRTIATWYLWRYVDDEVVRY